MNSQNNKNSLNLKILTLAKKILDLKVGIIQGCREMIGLLSERDIDLEKYFLVFKGVESETDALPIGQIRENWNKEQLKLKDKEIEEVENYYKRHVFETCENLIKFLENE